MKERWQALLRFNHKSHHVADDHGVDFSSLYTVLRWSRKGKFTLLQLVLSKFTYLLQLVSDMTSNYVIYGVLSFSQTFTQ